MPLPKVTAPTFELNLLSSSKPVKYRPFLVKEEKVLLIALENGNEKDIAATIKEVLKSCIITRGIKVDELPSFDLEYLFLNIRGKSVGEEVDVNVVCPDDRKTSVPVTISIDEIQVEKSKEHTTKIQLDPKLMMEMKYPSLDQFIKNNFEFKEENAVEQSFDLIATCIDKIYNDEEVWAVEDCTKKEISDFLESMNSSQLKKVESFFETMTKLSHTIK